MGASRPLSKDNYLGNKSRQTTSAFLLGLTDIVQEHLNREPDSALLEAMVEACHQHAIETTGECASDDELLYFTAAKAKIIAQSTNIRNHLAVLRKAVPECFLGAAFVAFRVGNLARKEQAEGELERLEKEMREQNLDLLEKQAQFALWDKVSARHKRGESYDMQAIMEDPELDEIGRRQAQGMIDRLGRFTNEGL